MSKIMSISHIRKLFRDEENRKYPPSLDLWKQLLDILDNKTDDEDEFNKVQQQLRFSVQRYKPSLPEPTLIKFLYDGKYYFLDPKSQIYKINDKHPLTGDLVGYIKDKQVIINDKCVKILDTFDVKNQKLYQKDYYVDQNRVFEGLHPNLPYIYHIGKLKNGKIVDII